MIVNGEKTKHKKFSHRNKLKKYGYDRKEYNQRSKVETINSVIKRVLGKTLLSKSWSMQKRELLIKCLTYNIYRLTKISGGFQ